MAVAMRLYLFSGALLAFALVAGRGALSRQLNEVPPVVVRRAAPSAKPSNRVAPRRELQVPPSSSASSDPALHNTAVFASRAECERQLALGNRAMHRAGTARIGSWNVRWFPDGIAGSAANTANSTDVEWLACAVAFLNVDVLALEEVKAKTRSEAATQKLVARLTELTGERHNYRVDDCPESNGQHLAWVWSEPRVTVKDFQMHAAVNPNGDSCKGQLRPGFGVALEFPHGLDLHAIAVHLKSGTTLRDLALRSKSLVGLNDAITSVVSRSKDADVLVLGDMNTMGAPLSADQQRGAAETLFWDGRLAAFRQPLRRLPSDLGCSAYYLRHPGLLDHFLVTSASKEIPITAKTETFGYCRTLGCQSYSGKAPLAMTELSDHCPIVLNLTDSDLD